MSDNLSQSFSSNSDRSTHATPPSIPPDVAPPTKRQRRFRPIEPKQLYQKRWLRLGGIIGIGAILLIVVLVSQFVVGRRTVVDGVTFYCAEGRIDEVLIQRVTNVAALYYDKYGNNYSNVKTFQIRAKNGDQLYVWLSDGKELRRTGDKFIITNKYSRINLQLIPLPNNPEAEAYAKLKIKRMLHKGVAALGGVGGFWVDELELRSRDIPRFHTRRWGSAITHEDLIIELLDEMSKPIDPDLIEQFVRTWENNPDRRLRTAWLTYLYSLGENEKYYNELLRNDWERQVVLVDIYGDAKGLKMSLPSSFYERVAEQCQRYYEALYAQGKRIPVMRLHFMDRHPPLHRRLIYIYREFDPKAWLNLRYTAYATRLQAGENPIIRQPMYNLIDEAMYDRYGPLYKQSDLIRHARSLFHESVEQNKWAKAVVIYEELALVRQEHDLLTDSRARAMVLKGLKQRNAHKPYLWEKQITPLILSMRDDEEKQACLEGLCELVQHIALSHEPSDSSDYFCGIVLPRLRLIEPKAMGDQAVAKFHQAIKDRIQRTIRRDDWGRCYLKLLFIPAHYKNAIRRTDPSDDTFTLVLERGDLLTTVERNDVAQAKALIAAGADLKKDFDDKRGSLLTIALLKDHFDIASYLIAQGVSVNETPKEYPTPPLLILAGVGSEEAVAFLLKHGADPDQMNSSKTSSALHEAVGRGRIKTMECLLDAGADVNIRCRFGYNSTLIHAAAAGQTEAIRYLLKHGADPDRPPALVTAVEKLNLPMVKTLVNAGVDINRGVLTYSGRKKYLRTPLDVAVDMKSASMVKKLLDMGADPNVPHGRKKSPPLHGAASAGDVVMMKFLLDKGANVNGVMVKNSQGTPLMAAIRNQKMDAIKLLLKHGADPNAPDNNGQFALDIAKYYRKGVRQSVVNLLLQYNAEYGKDMSKSGY